MTHFAFMLMGWATWIVMAAAFWQMRKAARNYRKLWRDGIEIMDEIQVENERLVTERDEAVALSQAFHKLAQKAEGQAVVDDAETWKQRQWLSSTLNEHIQRTRAERDAFIEKNRARAMAARSSPPRSGDWARRVNEILKENGR